MLTSFLGNIRKEFSGYNTARLLKDMMAGLTVCAVALPLALAFGVSSGATAAAGLVTAIIAGIVIGLLGGASYQISGPTGAMSAVLIGIVAQYGLQGVFFACFAAGVLMLAAGLLKLGRLISFIPMPVIMGFTSGIAIIIAMGQIDNFFGTASQGSSNLEKLLSYGRLGFHPNWQAVGIGLLVVFIMLVWPKKWGTKIPGSLVGIIAAAVAAALLGLDHLAVVGDIPRTLLLADRLSLSGLNLEMLSGIISPAVTIAALGMIESLLCGASAARMKNEPFSADQELIAQGLGNMLLPFFGGVPATAAIARTSVAVKSGQQTRLTSVFHSIFLLASMFLLGGVMARLPLAALAGVLMVTAWRMNDWAGIRYIFSHRFLSAISQFLITMLATVVFNLTVAILLGVIYSAILYMAKSSRIHVAFSTIDSSRLRGDIGKSPALDSAGVVYVTGSLFFGAVDEFNHRMQEVPEEDHLILSMRGMPSVDVSGAQAVLELCQHLLQKGHTIAFCGVAEDVRIYFDRAGITELVGEEAYFYSADKAILALLDEELQEA
ncbi:MAG TPA: SulP family inorganic anion transporter [Ruminococcaceae bacterium]|nr:SulP family inorganic anion transporter [Oscillospiraceae bacterium]